MPEADTAYIRDAVSYAATFMSSVHVEVFPMQVAEYTQLAEAGCRALFAPHARFSGSEEKNCTC